jgi:hypothetical protein
MCNSKTVPVVRTSRFDPHPGPDAVFPNNPKSSHAEGCVFNHTTYTCSCGLVERQMANGEFVRYVASFGERKPLHEVHSETMARDAMNVDMVAFNKRA